MRRRMLPLLALPAFAQGFPERTVTLMNGFAPGGSSDIVARIAAPALGISLGQSVVVENRPGAGGAVALEHIRHQRPDGYLVIISDPSALVVAPAISAATVRYDASRDFTPLGMFGSTPMVLIVAPGHPARDVAGLAAWLRQQRGAANFSSSGIGATTHLAAELFLQQAGGLEATHVPYRGGGQMVEAVMKNEVGFGFAVLNSAAGQIRGGLVRALAVSSPQRHPGFPDVPTTAQAGLPGLDLITWLMLLGPPAMAVPVVSRWSMAMTAMLGDAPTRTRLEESGVDAATPTSPQATAAFLVEQQARYRAIVAAAGSRLSGG